MKPTFGTVYGGWKIDHMAFLVLSCLGTAFLAHFNAPTFYGDLENKTKERFNKVSAESGKTALDLLAWNMHIQLNSI